LGLKDKEFERKWRGAVRDGFFQMSLADKRDVTLQKAWLAKVGAAWPKDPALKQRSSGDEDVEVVFRPDPNIFDGSFANNGWLQEVPRPVTKLAWDNAALISPAMAHKLGIENETVVAINLGGRSLEIPVWIVPGQAAQTVTLHLGFGRTMAGHVGNGIGTNVYPLRTSANLWSASGAEIKATARTKPLATTQSHHSMEGRDLVRHADLTSYREQPDFAQHEGGEEGHEVDDKLSMFPDHSYEGHHAWGMTIDLAKCTGCNACVLACQSENNIAVVGKDQVRRGREMQWIRIDRYYEGGLDNPSTLHQPVACMHCEKAPCELVCPVNATVHSSEGLNEMVYNRCVGTRYCANNCPYKVRRFNFYLYQDWETETLKMQRNPDVTVRSRGVMEKCSYCVQRINKSRIAARRKDQRIVDGDVVTACQGACPSNAIIFGDINEKGSKVAESKKDSRNYGLLSKLGIAPRTTYLASVTNPNPKLSKASSSGEAVG